MDEIHCTSWIQKRRESVQNFFRFIALSKYLDSFITITIVANCIVLAIADYTNVNDAGQLLSEGSVRNTIISESEFFFTAIFTAECVIKILGFGLWGKHSYLADRWNWLDFLVVITRYLS